MVVPGSFGRERLPRDDLRHIERAAVPPNTRSSFLENIVYNLRYESRATNKNRHDDGNESEGLDKSPNASGSNVGIYERTCCERQKTDR